MRVDINGGIARRGRSGSGRVVDLIRAALSDHADVRVHQPALPRARVLRLAAIFHWDMRGAGLRARGTDLFVSPAGSGIGPRDKPHILIMHDTMVLDRPNDFDPGFRAYALMTYGPSVRRASLILTGSHHAADAIRRRWSDAPPIEVIRWPGRAQSAATERTLPPRRTRVVVLGATEPHKNHVGAIEAVRFARLALQRDLVLDLVGPAGRAEHVVQRACDLVDPDSTWIRRHVDAAEDDVARFLERADVLLQPSLAEGYGLPVVEAAGFGTPVIHGGIPSLVELHPTGGAAGTDPTSLAEALTTLLGSEHAYRSASRHSLEVGRALSHSEFHRRLWAIVDGLR